MIIIFLKDRIMDWRKSKLSPYSIVLLTTGSKGITFKYVFHETSRTTKRIILINWYNMNDFDSKFQKLFTETVEIGFEYVNNSLCNWIN
jgi:hypothetical protein